MVKTTSCKENAATPAAHSRSYVSPSVEVVLIQSEGVLCSSVVGIDNEDFTDGGSYEF